MSSSHQAETLKGSQTLAKDSEATSLVQDTPSKVDTVPSNSDPTILAEVADADGGIRHDIPQTTSSEELVESADRDHQKVPSKESAATDSGRNEALDEPGETQSELTSATIAVTEEPKDTEETHDNGRTKTASGEEFSFDYMASTLPPSPPPKDEKYLNTGTEPVHTQWHSPRPTGSDGYGMRQPDEGEFSEKEAGGGLEESPEKNGEASRSEIQSIMEQFDEGMGGPGMEEIMSHRLEITSPVLHPPRHSSLEPHATGSRSPELTSPISEKDQPGFAPPRRTSSLYSPTSPLLAHSTSQDHSSSSRPPSSIYKPPPPEPDPEPDLPFDFHRFLEQLRHRTADPVAKFLRSFLLEFGKKQWMVHEQVKIISDFLEFIAKKMAMCEVWRTVSDAEFDNAREGMEKLVMNRLYTQTFSPAIPAAEPLQGRQGRRKGAQTSIGPGRRGQHQEDVERDEVLAQKVRIYGWVTEEHLDIKPIGDKGRKFLGLAQQELLKIKSYRAPRDKVICVLNCCKVIFGFLRNSQSDQSADSFIPLLIYTVLKAQPENLVSNVQYILRFRNQDKLGGEAGYYISSLMAAVQFIEGMDRTSFTISDDDFEKNVEAAVSAIAEGHAQSSAQLSPGRPQNQRQPSPHGPLISEKSSLSRAEVTPRNSLEAERVTPRQTLPFRAGNLAEGSSADDGDNDAVTGLLRTIQRPLSTIGRLFTEDSGPQSPSKQQQQQQKHQRQRSTGQPAMAHRSGSTPRLSPTMPSMQRRHSEDGRMTQQQRRGRGSDETARQQIGDEDAAARQASVELAEAQRITRAEHRVVVETLAGMFPTLDREVIDDVVRVKEGRVGLAVDACLALSN